MRAREITTSSGVDDLTLSGAVHGYETFNDSFSNDLTDAGKTFQYFVTNLAGTEWEYGFGSLDSSANLLRDVCLHSSVGAATKVDFTGETKYVSATVNHLIPSLPTVYSSATARLIGSGYWPFTQDSGLVGQNKVVYVPFRYDCSARPDGIWLMISGVGAADTVIGGVYTMQPSTGQPLSRIAVTVETTVSSTGTTVLPFMATDLYPGWYFLAINIKTGGNLTFRSTDGTLNPGAVGILGRSAANNNITHFTEDWTFNGTMPAKTGTLTAVSNEVCPILGLRVI